MVEIIILFFVGIYWLFKSIFNYQSVVETTFAPIPELKNRDKLLMRKKLQHENKIKRLRKIEKLRMEKKRLAEKYNISARMNEDTVAYYQEMEKVERTDVKARRLADIRYKLVNEALKQGKLPPGIVVRAR